MLVGSSALHKYVTGAHHPLPQLRHGNPSASTTCLMHSPLLLRKYSTRHLIRTLISDILRGMIDDSTASGWVVVVVRSATGGGLPKFVYFNAAIQEPELAVEATKNRPESSPFIRVQTLRRLSSHEIKEMGLETGEVRPAQP